ncbi:NAD-dependent protein deacetylase of SIR2 family [Kribbella turkmenica]|uniref:NAD-dependent protein deacetylase of SIR2 family n=1 Tax=Kribbella turkmenica TaxID=2530375 RepID=A0A4R4XEE7_9ACTN|nr:NAD-dependent protein deacetylase of SIR2 family [Kribbella turkmenica]
MPAALEITCDESGYEGEKLVGGVTDVFAHASVRIDDQTAADCITELRLRIRSPATMYKANHLLRSKHRAVLLWLLGPDGPLLGNARVFLVDKTYFLACGLVGHLGARPALARFLYDAARRTAEAEAFLVAANDFLRFTFRDQHPVVSPLDPLIPAIVRAVEYWGSDGRPVAIAHDRQTTLSPERVFTLRRSAPNFAGLEQVDSFTDQRVQVADFLAGVARKVASDQLKGADDTEVSALLRPYLDPRSLWIDEPSWTRLTR